MRHSSACVQCRTSKRKCIKRQQGQSCEDCARTGNQCSLLRRPSHASRLLIQPAPKHPTVETHCHQRREAGDLSGDDIYELVRTYFHYIHDRPHSLFHEVSLWRSIDEGNINKALLYGICSLAACLSTRPDSHRLASDFAAYSKKLLAADLEHVCIESIQTCILIANFCAAQLEPQSEALYFGASATCSRADCD